MQLDWSQEDRYRSNDGIGPLTARILCASNTEVKMERWNRNWRKAVRFVLPLKFFLSPRCGWKLVHKK